MMTPTVSPLRPRAGRSSARTTCAAMATLLAATGLVACAKRIPLAVHQQVSGVEELRQRAAAARSPVQRYFAEARLVYMGPQGRVKGSATLAVARPGSLRYDIVGPTGTVMEAFATDGERLQLLNPGQERFIEGPASAANIDRLTSFAPLRLSAEAWVALLFGEVEIPADAALHYDDAVGRFVLAWPVEGGVLRVEMDPESSRVTRAKVSQGAQVVSDVEVTERNALGLPVALRMRAPGKEIDLRVNLRDIEIDPEGMSATTFRLQAPRGITPQLLSADQPPPPTASPERDGDDVPHPSP